MHALVDAARLRNPPENHTTSSQERITDSSWVVPIELVSRNPRRLHHGLNIPADKKSIPGGKAKPLKAPKKAAKDMDDDDKAFLEKKKAGTS